MHGMRTTKLIKSTKWVIRLSIKFNRKYREKRWLHFLEFTNTDAKNSC